MEQSTNNQAHHARQQKIAYRQERAIADSPRHKLPYSTTHTELKSINTLKTKIRDLNRLLQRSEILPADVRMEKERALAGYKTDLDKAEELKKARGRKDKYKMVRFFESQKAGRSLKRAQKQLAATETSSNEFESMKRAVHEAEVDLNYTLYYPLLEKYQSLYPRKGDQPPEDTKNALEIGGRGERKVGGEKPPLWYLIEASMASGTLEAIRDSKGTSIVLGLSKPSRKGPKMTPKIKDLNRGGGVKLTGGAVEDDYDEDEEMSDGGFFEE